MTNDTPERDHDRGALTRFETLLDAYGTEPRRWPADRRAESETLLQRSSEARAMRDAAARLDALLDTASIQPAPADLVGRVLAAAPKARASRGLSNWIAGFWKPVMGLACAAMFGVALGGVVSPFQTNTADAAEADSVSLDIGSIPEIEL
jgi:hypothetical protein